MFLAELMTTLTEAMKQTFDMEYPVVDFRNLNVGIEFPAAPEQYPGIWVDFEPTQEMQTAGIGHIEYAEGEEGIQSFRRWTYSGFATYTIVALSNFERVRLFDEVVKVMAFGADRESTSQFRHYIESNEFIGINFDFDQIGVRGKSEAQGTPWGTDEMIYEITIAMECLGEFVSDGAMATLVPLSAVQVHPWPLPAGDPDPEAVGWR